MCTVTLGTVQPISDDLQIPCGCRQVRPLDSITDSDSLLRPRQSQIGRPNVALDMQSRSNYYLYELTIRKHAIDT